jgi:hypothetical protein
LNLFFLLPAVLTGWSIWFSVGYLVPTSIDNVRWNHWNRWPSSTVIDYLITFTKPNLRGKKVGWRSTEGTFMYSRVPWQFQSGRIFRYLKGASIKGRSSCFIHGVRAEPNSRSLSLYQCWVVLCFYEQPPVPGFT